MNEVIREHVLNLIRLGVPMPDVVDAVARKDWETAILWCMLLKERYGEYRKQARIELDCLMIRLAGAKRTGSQKEKSVSP